MLNMKEIMDVSMRIACSIRARSLQRRLFRAYLEEADCNHTDLLLHTDVRWLSRGKFLQRFRELHPEMREFLLGTKHAEYKQLDDDQWLLDLAFLTDLTNMLNELNLELQGKDKTVVNMISSVNAFKRKLQLLSSKLHALTVRATQSRLKMSGQTLTNDFKTLLYLSQSLHLCAFHLEKILRLIPSPQKSQHCFT